MYVLNLSEDKRVLSVGEKQEGVGYVNMAYAETEPDTSNGQWLEDYIFDEKTGEYIYDPKEHPEPPTPEPTADELLNAISRGLGYE